MKISKHALVGMNVNADAWD